MVDIQEHGTEFFDRNKELETDSNGKRFGDGQIVASVPMPLFKEVLAPLVANKDRKAIKKFLNDPDYSKLRTFRGRI